MTRGWSDPEVPAADLQGLPVCAQLQGVEFGAPPRRELVAQGQSQAGKVSSGEWRLRHSWSQKQSQSCVCSNGEVLCWS